MKHGGYTKYKKKTNKLIKKPGITKARYDVIKSFSVDLNRGILFLEFIHLRHKMQMQYLII